MDHTGVLDINDVIATARFLFLGAEFSCLGAADINDDGSYDLLDVIGTLTFLFCGWSCARRALSRLWGRDVSALLPLYDIRVPVSRKDVEPSFHRPHSGLGNT